MTARQIAAVELYADLGDQDLVAARLGITQASVSCLLKRAKLRYAAVGKLLTDMRSETRPLRTAI